MKVRVKLYGTLSQSFPDYERSKGIEVEIPVGATVKDLLASLGIAEPKGVTVIVEGRILQAGDTVQCGVPVSVLQAMHGG